ncbi:MAG: response regulator [Myxococcota bacterium]
MTARVLLIDDNPIDGRLVRAMLAGMRDAPFRIEHATELEAGCRIAQEPGVEAVLLDLSLRDVSGVDAVVQVRRRAPEVPIVVLTGHDDDELARQALEEGAEDYLVKGTVDGELLVRCVRYAIERNRRRIEREALAAQMAQTDRLAAVGLLAAGIAHEINNPLTYVLGNIDLAALRLRAARGRAATGEELAAVVDGVIALLGTAAQGAQRVRSIVHELRTFTRATEREPTPVSVLTSLEWVATMSEKEVSRTARFVRSFEPVPPVLADDARLGQIFLALVLNAVDAFEAPDPARNRVEVRARVRDGQVLVEVEDNGRGIPREIRARIFEPFFTTKEVGRGTGLGLYVCRNLVTQLGGRLEVVSEPGRGACFRVWLPPWSEARPEPPVAPRPTSARLLLVDDDPYVLDALGQMLALDYDVALARSTEEARGLLEARSFDYALVDLMLPDRASQRLLDELRARGHPLAGGVIFMTGGAFSPDSQQFLREVANPCLAKPFSPEDLASAMARCKATRGA